MSYTPGPWEFRPYRADPEPDRGMTGFVFGQDDETVYAVAEIPHHSNGMDVGNARLIELAPAMHLLLEMIELDANTQLSAVLRAQLQALLAQVEGL